MTEAAQQPPKQQDLSGPLHRHLGSTTAQEAVKEGHVALGKTAPLGRGGGRISGVSAGAAEGEDAERHRKDGELARTGTVRRR